MRVHRFYVSDRISLKKDFWLHDEAMLWQWSKVLRFRPGQEVILFDGQQTDRLYKITKLEKTEAHLEMVTEMHRHLPKRHLYLFWSLLKKDNNDLILQKCTELGVSTFVPILGNRTVRDNFNIDRARKIILEASEQCGRSDIPTVREPMHIETAIKDYQPKARLFVCQQGADSKLDIKPDEKVGVFIGPEGGWSQDEKNIFEETGIGQIHISDFTLRAETAAIAATHKLAAA